jgi:uncharacterized membrane protein YphA (DoxX/SURF4 family)
MKLLTHIARVLVGGLFIFSGLVKANDPKGLAFKMQEFFEVWARDGFLPKLMKIFDENALPFSIIMITLEVVLGVALLVGWQKKITTWLLFLLMLFFTFLTAFVLFTGKIKACGCFGDCIPLTPEQTFTKDIILLVLIVFLLFTLKHIQPIAKNIISAALVLLPTLGVLYFQYYVLGHLPVKDCLPYKPGNNIVELQKMPTNAVPDKYEFMFVYKKGEETKEFPATALPDSTWTFVDRKQKLIQKGSNNIPVISDFSLTTVYGNDSTQAILATPGEYFVLYIKDVESLEKNWAKDIDAIKALVKTGKPIYVATPQLKVVQQRYDADATLAGKFTYLTCDATILKTVARTNPTLYKMNGAVVQQKWGYKDFDAVIK